MRLLQVIDSFSVGGAERVVVTLSNLLYKKGVNVSILLLVKGGEILNELHPDIPVVNLRRKKRFDISKMNDFLKYADTFDIIHVHLKHNYRYAIFISKIFSKKWNIILHDHSHNYKVSVFSLKYFKDSLFKTLLKPSYYIGVSEKNCEWAKRYLNIKSEHCYLLENIIIKEEIEESNLKREGIVIVSNITRIKQLEFAIKLAKELGEKLTVYGKIYDEEYYHFLKRLVKNIYMTNNITFIFDCNNVQPELTKYKFALHTSFMETGPLVLIEYLAQSLPFLSFESGQVYASIGKQIPEFFINSFNSKDWIIKCKNLELVSKTKMKNVYETNFSSINYVEKCLKIYQKILDS